MMLRRSLVRRSLVAAALLGIAPHARAAPAPSSRGFVVDDGDEAPLPLGAARASAIVGEIRLVAPAGDYTLLTGDPQARAPECEIERARDRVLAAPAGDAVLGPLVANARYRPRPTPIGPLDRYALWAVLVLAIAVLGTLTLRLSRRERGDRGDAPAPRSDA